MIDHQYRCIFIHQRKCAGTSIIRAFDLDPGHPDWRFLNDGALSPDYDAAPAGYFRFAVVRNPWDRFVSGWKYCATTRHRSLHDVLADLPRDGHDYRHLTRPQHATLFGGDGHLVVDHLVRFESVQQDFDRVCDIIGKPRRVLAPGNSVARTHDSDYFDEASRGAFLPNFGRDAKLFGYHY